MSDQASNNTPPGAPGGAPAPAPAGDNGAISAQPAPTSQRPAWAPEPFWNSQTGQLKADEFGKHYQELATRAEAEAGLAARKPEDIKIALTLPDDVKAMMPVGVELKVDDKDPRIPLLREVATKHRLPQAVIDDLVLGDAKLRIAEETALVEFAKTNALTQADLAELRRPFGLKERLETVAAQIAHTRAEQEKLGANGPDRLKAIANWTEGAKWRGELSAEEANDIRSITTTAVTVGWVEKIMKRLNGGVAPNNAGNSQPKPAQADQATRWYGSSQQKAS